ncbi:SusC/RagA family TonB-linked outer membrane protein [Belliella sp. DSM 111904]|uniref:SusC/RagA family TonB-linked outer membrane protein n=1 Tax=Belliella filtrata TaxID=2923435 RepID=A0ABS9V2P3_9BACT|nr:SusC/RagA family TonB-linked outer membrane protein [Belliella filtrata]MCH7410690.1 SusC/RagA family TonB-linked outer membrane protein [Belliella filtrata]
MKKILLIIGIYLIIFTQLHAQGVETRSITGTVLVENDESPLPGAMVKLKNSVVWAIADDNGEFEVMVEGGTYQLEVSFLGYLTQSIEIAVPQSSPLVILMQEDELSLEAVEVVSTGYQQLPKERATGSFVFVDNELVDRRVSTNILERIEDVASGVIFNRDTYSGSDPISIRGRSTIFAESKPLIVIDNFPYDGPIENINPNDVENITILRDAAAASIWGARAGNGVIVITTKKGRFGSEPQVSLNSNITFGEKPDLWYYPNMGFDDLISVEKMLFDRGFYNSQLNAAARPPLSPVVETLVAEREGRISPEESSARLLAFSNQDSRSDLSDHFYRTTVNRQLALNISGGGNTHRYTFSAGYDKNDATIVGNGRQRISLNTQNHWSLLRNRLEVSLGMYYTNSYTESGTEVPTPYPYERLVDENGNPTTITQGYSRRYIESIAGQGLLDWSYIPLEEIGLNSNLSSQNDIRVNTTLGYNIANGLKAEVLYQYWANSSSNKNHRPEGSYYARNQVNRFTQRNADGSLFLAIPEGGILDLGMANMYSHSLRGQLTHSKDWNTKHNISSLAGFEMKDLQSEGNSTRYYGYNDDLGISLPVDHTTRFRLYHNNSLSSIGAGAGHTGVTDRFVSMYFNTAYTYDKKYVLSTSIRKDASNIFGVETNMRGVPLWSTGFAWIVSRENFYHSGWLPYLKLRATYGYNGNVDKSLSSYTTAIYAISSSHDVPPGIRRAIIINPPNPELRWEKIGVFNLALDFETKNSTLSGSVEFYTKNGTDLIGDMRIPPSAGMTQFRGNYANTKTNGVDLNLNSHNLKGKLNWNTNFLLSFVDEKVTSYQIESNTREYLGPILSPKIGMPLFSIYSLPTAGLDPDNGNPLGYLDGEISTAYSQIIAGTTPDELIYHGSGRPVVFGALRNSFDWKGLNLSFNISYRLGYYYRRPSVNYFELLNGRITHNDFEMRWQNPGDELHTQIPSMPQGSDTNRNYFYQFSSVLVEKGDHIRLQDIRLSYTLDRRKFARLPFQRAEIYSYANNIGILWKASDDQLDPDFQSMRALRSIAFGVRVDF